MSFMTHVNDVSVPEEIRSNQDVQVAAREAALKYIQRTELEKIMNKKYKDTPEVSRTAENDAEVNKRMVIINDGNVKVVEPAAEDLQKMQQASAGETTAMDRLRDEVTKVASKLGIDDSIQINRFANALEFQARPKRESAISR